MPSGTCFFLLFFLFLQATACSAQQDSFVRAPKIIFQDDFAKQKTSDVPKNWTTNGSATVDTSYLAPGKWLKIPDGKSITCNRKPIALPDTFTIEFDVIPMADPKRNGWDSYGFTIMSTHKPEDLTYGISRPGDAGIKFDFGMYNYYNTYYDDGAIPMKGSTSGIKTLEKQVAGNLYKMAFRINKTRITVWRNGILLFDLPYAMSLNYHYNMLRFENGMPMVRNFKVSVW